MWFTWPVIWFSPLLPSTQPCWATALHALMRDVLRLPAVVVRGERHRVAVSFWPA